MVCPKLGLQVFFSLYLLPVHAVLTVVLGGIGYYMYPYLLILTGTLLITVWMCSATRQTLGRMLRDPGLGHGNFDITSGHFSRFARLYATHPHTHAPRPTCAWMDESYTDGRPCNMIHVVIVPVGVLVGF